MVKFFSDDFFKEVETTLTADPKWQEGTKGMKSTILLSATDLPASYLLTVESGNTSIQKTETPTPAEFSFEGTYEVWSRVGKGDLDLQSAVLKGSLRFKGSITKILFYKDRFLRIADAIKGIQKEY
ncbi:MAG: SCP2 sterol-binding domain-containing protein [Thaumarchaeota archaeon]|nr:SCP2 sterol-binding domain-containing protein [Nitrososphaerota archaeon]